MEPPSLQYGKPRTPRPKRISALKYFFWALKSDLFWNGLFLTNTERILYPLILHIFIDQIRLADLVKGCVATGLTVSGRRRRIPTVKV